MVIYKKVIKIENQKLAKRFMASRKNTMKKMNHNITSVRLIIYEY